MGTKGSSKSEIGVPTGTVINRRWCVATKLGRGAFGAVFEVVCATSKQHYAMKIESKREDGAQIKMEIAVLKTFRRRGRGTSLSHVCQYIDRGETSLFRYVVMELVGSSLSDLRKSRHCSKFSESTTVRLGAQCLEAIEAVHRIGFIHRDIKPANLAMGRGGSARLVYILDFGLARQYITLEGTVRPPRKTAGFRGTVRYASINAHLRKDLGRHDDLWSWLYVLIEFYKGELPWHSIYNKEEVKKMKTEIVADDLLKGMPKEFFRLLNELHGLQYPDMPNYAWFYQQMKGIMIRNKYKDNDPFDWER